MTFSIRTLLLVTAWIAIVASALTITPKLDAVSFRFTWPMEFIAYVVYATSIFSFILALIDRSPVQHFWIGYAAVCAVMILGSLLPNLDVADSSHRNALAHNLAKWIYVDKTVNLKLSGGADMYFECVKRILVFGSVPLLGFAGGLFAQWFSKHSKETRTS